MKNQQRLDRDSYYITIAQLVALRGTCNKLKVGCVLVRNKRIAATGYNSSHSGTPHCNQVGCLLDSKGRCRRVLHAEVAAALDLDKKPGELEAYITHFPCPDCYKLLAAINVKHIYYIEDYKSSVDEEAVWQKVRKEIPHIYLTQIKSANSIELLNKHA